MKMTKVLEYDERCDANYDTLRYAFEESLKESGNYHGNWSEIDDGWAEFCQAEYEDEYLYNLKENE